MTVQYSGANSGVRKGSCVCGAIKFETRGELRDVIFCHCEQCRKQSGHYFAATSVSDDRLYVSGEEQIGWYSASPSAKRGFCRNCGSALFWKREDSDATSVMAGLFDSPTGLEGGYHIFTAEKGDYYAITDGLPCFAGSKD
ncbi:MAG: GFA family protein [Methylobacterium mesophilicum]|nr:GFA family protein [Methylobacterium mesophilicum]